IDMRTQAEVPSMRRPDTPRSAVATGFISAGQVDCCCTSFAAIRLGRLAAGWVKQEGGGWTDREGPTPKGAARTAAPFTFRRGPNQYGDGGCGCWTDGGAVWAGS